MIKTKIKSKYPMADCWKWIEDLSKDEQKLLIDYHDREVGKMRKEYEDRQSRK